MCMAVHTYGAIPCTTETEPEKAIPCTMETEPETELEAETDTEPETENRNGNGTVNIRDFGLSTRIRLFVRIIFSVCLYVYFLGV